MTPTPISAIAAKILATPVFSLVFVIYRRSQDFRCGGTFVASNGDVLF